MTSDEPLELEMARRWPWTCAAMHSLWQVSGWITEAQPFDDQLAIAAVVDGKLRFRLLGEGLSAVVRPHMIVAGHPLIAVYADDPLTAMFVEEQRLVDRAIGDREDGQGVTAGG